MRKLADISFFESLGDSPKVGSVVFNRSSVIHNYGLDELGARVFHMFPEDGPSIPSFLREYLKRRALKKAEYAKNGRALRKAVESGDADRLGALFFVGDGDIDDGDGLTLRAKDGTAFYVFRKNGELMAMDVSRHPEWDGVITVGELSAGYDDEDEDIADDDLDVFQIEPIDLQPRI